MDSKSYLSLGNFDDERQELQQRTNGENFIFSKEEETFDRGRETSDNNEGVKGIQ